MGAGFTCPPQP